MNWAVGAPRGETPAMPVLRVGLLVAAIVGVIARPRSVPVWAAPVGMVGVAAAVGQIDGDVLDDALRPFVDPLLFLLLAVPLGAMLDELGFFAAVAGRVDRGRRLQAGLWAFAALVTTLLNLDASVVLLTPLYVRIARRHGLDPVGAAMPPILLACFASSALPVSNLTNLIAAEHLDLSATDFLVHLGPASLAATIVGYVAYRRMFPDAGDTIDDDTVIESDPRALRVGVPIVAFVVAGFTLGDAIGIEPWIVAAVADIALLAVLRRAPRGSIPFGAAMVAGSLGVLAAVAAGDLGVGEVVTGDGALSTLRIVGISAAGANVMNNLPGLLVALPELSGVSEAHVWAVMLGVNVGPVFLLTGSLAGLLWLDTTRRLGLAIDVRRYSRMAFWIGVPALVAAALTLLATNAVTL